MNCNICSSSTDIITDSKNNTEYHSCSNCDFIFLDPLKRIPPENEKERYLKHNNSIDNSGYVSMLEDFITACITPLSYKIENILDFGCGPDPVLASLLTNKRYTVDTYDKYFFPAKTFQGKKYALITLVEVIEHLPDPLETITALRNQLKPEGLIAIMTLFRRTEDNFLNWWYRQDPTHISFFSHKTIRHLATILGMQCKIINKNNSCILTHSL